MESENRRYRYFNVSLYSPLVSIVNFCGMRWTYQEEALHVVHPERRWGIGVENMAIALPISDLCVLLQRFKDDSSVSAIAWFSSQTVGDEDRLDSFWPKNGSTITFVE